MKYFLIFFLFFAISLQANTIEVCATCKAQSIKKAVFIAKDGDTILVKKGVYKETKISINKSIHIIGENYPIIDADNKAESVLIITADNFSIQGLKFKNIGLSTPRK